MYWREIYPNIHAAMHAERLGSLGKVKLTVAQKAAIQQAKADSKVSKIQGKTARAVAKSNVTIAKRDAQASVASAKAAAQVLKYQQPAAVANSTSASAGSDAFAQNMQALQQAANAPAEFSSAGSGGGGAPAYQPATDGASAAPSIFENIPLVVWLAAGGLVLFLVMRK